MSDDLLVAEVLSLRKPGVGDRSVWTSLKGRYPGLTRNRVRTIWMDARPALPAVIPPSGLSAYDTARRALAEAKSLGEVMEIANKAVALAEYYRRAKDKEMEVNVAELRIQAERKAGEILIAIKADGGIREGRPKKNGRDGRPFSDDPINLKELGISKDFSARAQKLAVFDDSAFGERLSEWRDRALSETKSRVTTDVLREAEQTERRAAHAAKTYGGGKVEDSRALAASGFRAGAILADPPWHFMARSERGEGRSAGQHYRTDALDEIKALPVAALAADDCVMFMWMVDWCPGAALEVIEAWGFAHKTCAFTWAKQNEAGEGWHMGQGYWTRANPEACWLATRGSPKRLYADVRQLIVAPVMEHSRKPDEVHDRIERLVQGPYLELYARRERQRWLTWGNEVAWRIPEKLESTVPIAVESPAPSSTSAHDGLAHDGLDIPAFLQRKPAEAAS